MQLILAMRTAACPLPLMRIFGSMSAASDGELEGGASPGGGGRAEILALTASRPFWPSLSISKRSGRRVNTAACLHPWALSSLGMGHLVPKVESSMGEPCTVADLILPYNLRV